jgi:subtilisin-like proprotein convertase family protein
MNKYWFFALLILAVAIAVVFSLKGTPPSANLAAARSTGVPPVMETDQRQAGRLPYDSAASSTSTPAPLSSASSEASRLAPFLSAPVAIQDGGRAVEFELATDQLYLRGSDGASRILAIPKTNTPEEFAAAIEKVRAEHVVEPELVLYPVGVSRNEYTRRIVTREVVVNAPSRERADAMAQAKGLVFRKAPAFASNAYIYEAPTSIAALGALMNQESSVDAAPLLASLSARKSMPNDPFVQLQWHLKYQGQQGAVDGTDINVESVWNYPSVSVGNFIRGGNVTIGIVDDGLEWSHSDLAPNMRNDLNWDWNGKDNDPKPDPFAYPPQAHGTACAGVAAARGNNRIGVSGVAPEANLVGMRLIAGDKTDLDEAEAMTWKMGNIHILSNSWGPSDNGATLRGPNVLAGAAFKYATDFGRNGKGTIITWAGGNGRNFIPGKQLGNDNSNYDGYANSIYTIAVGAIDSNGLQADYSESGANLVVSAPSDGGPLGIMTTDNKGRYGDNPGFGQNDFASSGDVTKNFGGTSSATPAVSGVIALMLEKNPDLGWRDVQEILIQSAKKIDSGDADWVDNGAGFHFNHKYGAGLVDAAAAVDLAGSWVNLAAQKSESATTTDAVIGAGATITRTFTVNGTNLRVEHVTLQLSVANIKKGNLTITLTSPGNTTSTFCLPHGDTRNFFTNWKFMTVRNWGGNSNGTWTLTITNNGGASGSLTDAELVVYGTESGPANPAPVVTLQASRTKVFVGSNFTLNATAINQKDDGSFGSVESLEAFVNGASLGVSANGTWTVLANEAGTFSFTVDATAEGQTTTSQAVMVEVLEKPIAAWDFDTTSQSPVPLATAVQSSRKYAANFGSGNMTFDGSFDGNDVGSNKWEYGQGQIFATDGTAVNAVSEMDISPSNKALLLRGGKNIGAEAKSIVFEFNMAGKEGLNVSYATCELGGGFVTQNWTWSNDGANWQPLETIIPASGFSAWALNQTEVLNDSATAYVRLEVRGATAASGQNFLDNIILSASPIAPSVVSEPFSVISRSSAQDSRSSAPAGSDDSSGSADSLANQGAIDQNPGWFAPEGGAYSMFLYAEVVDGAKFLNAPGSLLSVSQDNTIVGLAEAVPQTTRYELPISSAEAEIEPLRVRLYDASRQTVLVMAEKLEFQGGSILGTRATPKRFRVDYEEVEQVITIAQGWNSFTVALEPLPAAWNSILADYEATEGDRLVGPTSEAICRDGDWEPTAFTLESGATYSLWRQSAGTAAITLRGKALESKESHSAPLLQAPVRQQSVGSSGSASAGASSVSSVSNSEKKASKKGKKSDKKRGSKSKRKSVS